MHRIILSTMILGVLWVVPNCSACADEAIDPALARIDEKNSLRWYDLKQLHIEGRGWNDTKAFYDRLPAKAEQTVRPAVWSLSRHSAGLCARFRTNATDLHASWKLTSSRLAMPHMPATGVSGLDLYVRLENGAWRWLANGGPKTQSTTTRLVNGLPEGTREYLIYLPLYNGVSSVEIGVPADAVLSRVAPSKAKPIVFYGTSITQGGCASRPGMVHSAILGRRFDQPVINLGFSGNGRMEVEVAELMAEIDAAVYVLDCLPNLRPAEVAKRTEPVVKILRAAHPETPILLVEDRSYTDAFLVASKQQRNQHSREELRSAFERLKQAGTKQLYYLEGGSLLGDDGEGTVDSSHPTDLGFLRQADAFQHALEPILGSPGR